MLPETPTKTSDAMLEAASSTVEFVQMADRYVQELFDRYEALQALDLEDDTVPFSKKLDLIVQAVPASVYRNELITDVATQSYTTIEDLKRAKELLVIAGDITPVIPPALVGPVILTLIDNRTASVSQALNPVITENVGKINSIRPYNNLLSRDEVMRCVHGLCLGDEGILEGGYDQYGRPMVLNVIEQGLAAANSTFLNLEQIEQAKDFIGVAFDNLTPARRTQIFAELVDYLREHGVGGSQEELIAAMISSFGVLGNKLLQIDLVVPHELREIAQRSKEEVRPVDKFEVMRALEASFLIDEIEAIGPCIGSASTSSVYPLVKKGDEEYSTVIKLIRPEIADQLDADLKAVEAVAEHAAEQLGLAVDPQSLLSEISAMVREEIDPLFEKANLKIIDYMRQRDGNRYRISAPKIIHAHPSYVEMTIAGGRSLNKLLSDPELRENAALRDISKRVVGDFLRQVYVYGAFHTDIHEGNVFVDDDGTITEIDYGQICIESDPQKRRALMLFSLGMELKIPDLCALCLGEFSPETSPEIFKDRLSSADDILVETTQILAEYNVHGSIVRYMKAAANISPYMDYLRFSDKMELIYPHVRRYGLERRLLRYSPEMARYSKEKIQARKKTIEQ
jgi:hypothetical protein